MSVLGWLFNISFHKSIEQKITPKTKLTPKKQTRKENPPVRKQDRHLLRSGVCLVDQRGLSFFVLSTGFSLDFSLDAFFVLDPLG